jgi:hypothetical protein
MAHRDVHPNGATAGLLWLTGVLVGGTAVQFFSGAASVAIGTATVITIVCAFVAAVTGRDIARAGAIGGGAGLLIGVPLAAVDALFL